jgi:hypothetical protein
LCSRRCTNHVVSDPPDARLRGPRAKSRGRSRHGLSVRDRALVEPRMDWRMRRPATHDRQRSERVHVTPICVAISVASAAQGAPRSCLPVSLGITLGHHASILALCSASSMLSASASTPRSAGPSGMDNACAQHGTRHLRDGRPYACIHEHLADSQRPAMMGGMEPA